MASFLSGNSTTRSVAETVEKGMGHLSDKAMPKAIVRPPAKRYSPRPAGGATQDAPAAERAVESND